MIVIIYNYNLEITKFVCSLYDLYMYRECERERAFPFSRIVFEDSVLSTYNTFSSLLSLPFCVVHMRVVTQPNAAYYFYSAAGMSVLS